MGSNLHIEEHAHEQVVVRAAVLEDAVAIGKNFRPADRIEFEGVGADPVSSLLSGIAEARSAYTVVRKGEPCFVFGTSDDPEVRRVGVIWAAGTPAIELFPRLFLRRSRAWVERIVEPYDAVWNITHADNALHHKWLRWCGFTFIRQHPWGVNGEPYLEFAKPCVTPEPLPH